MPTNKKSIPFDISRSCLGQRSYGNILYNPLSEISLECAPANAAKDSRVSHINTLFNKQY